MNQNSLNITNSPEQSYFLSEILGVRVMIAGKKTGKLADIIIKENGTLPVATHFFVSLPFGESAVIPWEAIKTINQKEIVVSGDSIAPYKSQVDENAVMLKDHILDKKAIDLDGREMEVIYDVKLVLRNNRLYVSEVDLSRYGLLRRMGLTWLANFIYSLAESIREQTISWSYIQPLPEDLGRFRGDLRFRVLKERLADLHPVDLADILEEMDHDQRVEFFEELDPEQASDTFEEIDPSVQRDMVETLGIERVAHLIDEMTTGQASDVLSILSAAEASQIMHAKFAPLWNSKKRTYLTMLLRNT
jgi:magnesium transporter